VRQTERHRITHCSADHRVGDAGIAAGRIDNCLSRPERSARQACLNHAEGGAIFYRAAGIEPFGLGRKLNIGEFAPDSLKAQQRCISDALEDRLSYRTEASAGFACDGSCWHVSSQRSDALSTQPRHRKRAILLCIGCAGQTTCYDSDLASRSLSQRIEASKVGKRKGAHGPFSAMICRLLYG